MSINNLPSIPEKRAAGRPVGSRNKRSIFVEQLFTKSTRDLRRIVATAIKRAIAGDADFAKLVLQIVCPAPKGRKVSFNWPTGLNTEGIGVAFDAVLVAIGNSELTIDEGLQIANILKLKAEVLETHEVQTQITKLREEIEKLKEAHPS